MKYTVDFTYQRKAPRLISGTGKLIVEFSGRPNEPLRHPMLKKFCYERLKQTVKGSIIDITFVKATQHD